MARPLASGKQSVNLAASGVRVSRIRRNPPPPAKKVDPRDREERERSDMVVGVLAFTLALFAIALAAVAWSGWSPREYTLVVPE